MGHRRAYREPVERTKRNSQLVGTTCEQAQKRRNAKHGGRTIAVVIEEDEHE